MTKEETKRIKQYIEEEENIIKHYMKQIAEKHKRVEQAEFKLSIFRACLKFDAIVF